ncbi:MAG: hypothetical protein LLG04_16275, partial [Parachlamydia sp.]|nr:hypothetical protein [Parachlamydia sp.]
TSADFRDLKGAHNNLTRAHDNTIAKHNILTAAHDDLLVNHNLTVRVVDQQGQKIRLLEDLSAADTRRVDAVVQVLDAHTLEFRGQQARTDELSRGLAAANEALAASQRALAASEQARLEDKQAFEDRIKKLEENSTATTAISSQVNALMERFATHEQLYQTEKTQYAQRLIAAEGAIAEGQRENRELKATVVTLSEILEEVTINGAVTHKTFFGTVNSMNSKLDLVLERLPGISPGASHTSGLSSSPPPAAAQPTSPYATSLAKLNGLRVQRQENPERESRIVALPTAALGQPPAAAASGSNV